MPAASQATISSASGGNFENLVVNRGGRDHSVTDTIDTTTVTLTATPSVAEGGIIVYTASFGAPVTGRRSRDPVQRRDDHHRCRPSSGTVKPWPRDDVLSGHAPLATSISNATGGNFEKLVPIQPRSHQRHRHHRHHHGEADRHPSVAEGGSIVYTASLTSAAHAGDRDAVQRRHDHHRRGRQHRQRQRRCAGRRRVPRCRQRVGHDQFRLGRQLRNPGHNPAPAATSSPTPSTPRR